MLDYSLGLSLSERTTSAFPVSIGTSLALESLFSPQKEPYDPQRVIPNQVNPQEYQSFWVNVTTLFRNLSSAVSKESFLRASVSELTATIEEEIDVIQTLFQTEAQNLCKPIFYYSTYKKLKSQNTPGLSFREPSTEQQKFYHHQLENTLKLLERHSDTVKVFDGSVIPDYKDRSMILTHQPYDLVRFKSFEKLDLLESNTGVLKPRALWNSKYNPMSGKSFTHLPFTRKLLLIFGDKYLIKPYPPVLRNQILETSINRKWSVMTTDDKINLDLSLDVKDPYMAAVIKSL